MTPFGKKEIIMYLFTQDERSLVLVTFSGQP